MVQGILLIKRSSIHVSHSINGVIIKLNVIVVLEFINTG